MRDSSVVAENVSKSYFIPIRQPGFVGSIKQLFSRKSREVRAVFDVSFGIRQGEFVGYIGPNGAGKSTTIKMLTGILHPTAGRILVNGRSPQDCRQDVAWDIGVVFGQRTQLWWDLPTIDSFELLASMYDVKRDLYLRFLRQFTDLLGIDEFLDTPVRRLSLGQRMRADLAAALIHSPSVLFLDEPTIGLDVMAKARIREFLAHLNKDQGVTVLLTTHDLRDIEELCKRVIVINHGHLIYDGELGALRDQAGLPTVMSVRYKSLPSGLVPGTYLSAEGQVSGVPSNGAWKLESVDYAADTVRLSFDRSLYSAPTVLWAMRTLGEIEDVSLTEPLIEEIIRRLLEEAA